MFNFQEAERRLRLGNQHIKRASWRYDEVLGLYNNLATGTKEPMILEQGRMAFWELSSEDLSATDWIDPAE